MPKYLFEVSYTAAGNKGVLAEGGSARVKSVREGIEKGGGKIECFYFAFGGTDAYVVAEHADHAAAASIAMRVGASGAATVRTVVLLTPEEVDAAAAREYEYHPPGG